MRAALCVLGAIFWLAACDPKGGSERSASPERMSSSYESCSSTLDCEPELRCRSGVCRPQKSVAVGEYHAAAGRLAVAEKRHEDAIAAYAEATKAFELSKVEMPPEVNCGQGEALIRAGGDPQRLELAARVLHRCLLASPSGTPTREQALALLAELGREGFDPDLLGKDTLSDRYMTGKPASPPVDELQLAVTVADAPKTSSFTRWMETAQSDAIRDALLPCWQEHWSVSREPKMTVSLPMKHGYQLDRYGDFGRTTLVVDPLTPTGDAAADGAYTCAKAAIDAIADEHTKKRQDERRWEAVFTFTLAPPG